MGGDTKGKDFLERTGICRKNIEFANRDVDGHPFADLGSELIRESAANELLSPPERYPAAFPSSIAPGSAPPVSSIGKGRRTRPCEFGCPTSM